MTKSQTVVVITGATAGVGRATAREFARKVRGCRIALLARGSTALEATRRELEEMGARVLAIPTDVASAQQVEDAAERTEQVFGPIDIWINNAMTSVFAPVRKLHAEEIRRVTEVTYLGVVHGTLSALRRMLPRDRGSIVQVGSALAYRSIPLQAAYCAAKHAVLGFTESLRTELKHDGSSVKVSLVHLPALNTPQFGWVRSRLPKKAQPVPPIFQPEVAARAIFRTAFHPRDERWVAFSTVRAILAERISPRLGDWYLARNGYESQQTEEPESEHRPDNLWAPVEGDFGAHGSFDERARARSLEVWLSLNRRWLAAAVAGVAVATLGFWRKKEKPRLQWAA